MCNPSAPCGGILRETLRTTTFVLRSCLNGHAFRSGAPPPSLSAPGPNGQRGQPREFRRIGKLKPQPERKR